MNDIPLSLYIHFPWCAKKCPYCDFNSHRLKNELPELKYINALVKDLDEEQQREGRRNLTSIFLGGGTPSLFSGKSINELMGKIRRYFVIDNCEITIEANPGSFDQSNFTNYRKAGINRISIGAQSFNLRNLVQLGRIHSPDDIFNAYTGARSAGFSRINIDLMFGLPDQNYDGALADLKQAIAMGPEHISWYQLTIEPNTIFYSHRPATPDDEVLSEIAQEGRKFLEAAGFKQYEVSAFATAGEYAKHNLNYWQFGDYIGLGAGAHSKVTRGNTIFRSQKTRMPADYMVDSNSNQTEIASNDVILEFLMNALRLTDGFEFRLFSERTGLGRKKLDSFISQARQLGFIEIYQDRVVPTERGRNFLDDMLLLA